MKQKELRSKISDVESLLNEFSFEVFDTEQAATLKHAFDSFLLQLREIIFENPTGSNQLPDLSAVENSGFNSGKSKSSAFINPTHYLRTPLERFIRITERLKENELNVVQYDMINEVRIASNALLDDIDMVFENSKPDTDLEIPECIDFNFYRLVGDVIFICKTLIVQKNVSLQMAIDPTTPEIVIGDPAKLSQLLLTLLGSSIKSVSQGQIHLDIAPKNSTDQLKIEFSISPNGTEIAKEDQRDILGYGNDDEVSESWLSTVLKIVDQLGGSLEVAHHQDNGATYNCNLPLTKGDETRLRKNDTTKEYLLEAAKFIKGFEILVFEDNPINQRFIEQRLKKWGCAVVVTDDGEYGLELLEKEHFDFVLTDLRMPGMSGIEITKCIRKHSSPIIKELPVIALTADFMVEDKEKLAAHGIDDYLLKPYSPDELLLKLISNKNRMSVESNSSEPLPVVFSTKIKEPEEFNLDRIFKDCMEQMDLVEELAYLYKQNVLEFIGQTKFQLMQKDFEALDFSLHKIKSGLAMMRTNDLLEIVKQMQSASKSDRDLDQLNFLYECFVTEYPIALAKIDSEINRLRKK